MSTDLFPQLPLLLVDDELPWLRSLSLTLRRSGGINNVILCTDSREAPEILARQRVCLVVLDLNMPHLGGLELLKVINRDFPRVPVVVATGLNQVETAVECMREGAFDFIVKTAEQGPIMATVRRALHMGLLQEENQNLRERFLKDELKCAEAFDGIITQHRKIRDIFHYIESIAASVQPVLITGESGVGKELFARAVHRTSRPEGPWVAVNVAGLDDMAFSDTLFGHLRGAFTGADSVRAGMIAKAQGGTLFLDEIGDLNLSLQVKLLRVLQEREYFALGSDVPQPVKARFVFATNQDLQAKVEQGTFRQDLYYRLRCHHISIPPLRERREDIPHLLDHMLRKSAAVLGKNKPTPPEELAVLLSAYSFPGNVRELEAMVFDAVSAHRSRKLSTASFKKALTAGMTDFHAARLAGGGADGIRGVKFPDVLPSLQGVQELLITEALKRSGGNQSIAAGLIGVSQQALSKRLNKGKG